jgi:tRNA(Ile)-lysidine synthase
LTTIKPEQVEYDSNNKVEFFDFDLISNNLAIRTWNTTDSFIPLGMPAGSMKLSDFLMNEKVPFLDKPNVLVLTNNDEVVWVCRHRISDKYKITTKTKRILKVEMRIKGQN